VTEQEESVSATIEPTQHLRTRLSGVATHAKSLKRYFIGPFIVLNAAGMIYSIVRCVISVAGDGHQTAAWAVAAGGHASVVAFGPRSWPQRDSGLSGLLALTAAATIAEAALLPASLAALIEVGVVAFLGSVAYATWYARFGREPATALRPGALLPDLALVTLDGDEFSMAELRGAPAALFFVRGAWCPFCSAQVRGVVAAYARLRERGVRVAVISPQPETEMRKLADRFRVELLWLRDPDLTAARRLGILDAGGVPAGALGFGADTVLPTLVVLDPQGHVVEAVETDNYRVRPDPDTVLAILNRAPVTQDIP
jgi:peroxiredoxin